jgi:aryl-alcohol dehydrogenase-like predicted oxidoreductase
MKMKRHDIPNTDLKVSSFCYGIMKFGTKVQDDEMFKLYHQFCDHGGNFFDTAHSYATWLPHGEGASERALGQCMQKFGNRSEIIVSTKGGMHTAKNYNRPDDCMTPEVISSDISDSLERLQLDYIDLYTLHRDDTRHPVSEIIETLNREIKIGRIRYIGASNWSIPRIVEANRYASSQNLQGFVVSSPQWNLAEANHFSYGWDGKHDITTVWLDRPSVRWYRDQQFPLMPWTPTAYGYFSDVDTVNAKSFDNPISAARRERTKMLAKQYQATAHQMALAYLLSQGFPVFPILGTISFEHLSESLLADQIQLSQAEVEWLRDGE